MLIKKRFPAVFTELNPINKTVSSVITTQVIDDETNEVFASNDHRCAFVPGEIEEVKKFIGLDESPEIDYLNAIWTPEVITAYQNSVINLTL